MLKKKIILFQNGDSIEGICSIVNGYHTLKVWEKHTTPETNPGPSQKKKRASRPPTSASKGKTLVSNLMFSF